MSRSPLQIGITGGIGSGKSVVCKIFNTLDIPTYDADSRAKWIMMNDKLLKKELINVFGKKTFVDNGEVNRKHLSSIIFNDKKKLSVLNNIVHPKVAEDYKVWTSNHLNHPYVIKEAALLYESGSYQLLDKIIVVTAPESLRISRTLLRDPHRSKVEIQSIISKQMPEHEKLERADYVIKNDESELLIQQVLDLHKIFSLRK
ncbi:MAG: dephospho-CoA kinase [Cyclobacteriaceae bacterium]|nr:dephospho-CoA kinase [Cyclobacteriaceae bacterium]